MDEMDMKEQLEELEDLRARRDEVFQKLKNDKDNPYWYQDWGCIVDNLDEQIAALEQKLGVGKEAWRPRPRSL